VTNHRPAKHTNVLSLIRIAVESDNYLETFHAQQRQGEREIILPDILHVLLKGYHEKQKDQFDTAWQNWNYAIRGRTISNQELRVIVAFDEVTSLLIITAFSIESR